MRVVTWGEVLWDLFPDGARLGGCAANVAFHLAQLGVDVTLVSRVGRDELGAEARRRLGDAGVDTSLIQEDAVSPTGTVTVTLDGGEPRFRIATQAAWDRITWTPAVASAVMAADVLYYGTLAQRTPLARGALREALRWVNPACVKVCDLNLRSPLPEREVVEASLRAASSVKLNESEAALLATLLGVPDGTRWLLEEARVAMVALTRGARGCVLSSVNERAEHPGFALPADGGDRVGAGDAFTAILCAALPRRLPLPALAELANRVAAHVAASPGATPLLPEGLRAAVQVALGAAPSDSP